MTWQSWLIIYLYIGTLCTLLPLLWFIRKPDEYAKETTATVVVAFLLNIIAWPFVLVAALYHALT